MSDPRQCNCGRLPLHPVSAHDSIGGADARPARAPQEQVAWLVALGSSPPQWWTGRDHEFTAEVDGTQRNPARSAMRFARREDAERAIGWLVKAGTRDGCRAEEHIWLQLPSEAADAALVAPRAPELLKWTVGEGGIQVYSAFEVDVLVAGLRQRIETLTVALDQKMDLAVEAELEIRRATVAEYKRQVDEQSAAEVAGLRQDLHECERENDEFTRVLHNFEESSLRHAEVLAGLRALPQRIRDAQDQQTLLDIADDLEALLAPGRPARSQEEMHD